MTLFTLIFMLCTAQNSQHSNCNLWVTVYRHKTFRFYTTKSKYYKFYSNNYGRPGLPIMIDLLFSNEASF